MKIEKPVKTCNTGAKQVLAAFSNTRDQGGHLEQNVIFHKFAGPAAQGVSDHVQNDLALLLPKQGKRGSNVLRDPWVVISRRSRVLRG